MFLFVIAEKLCRVLPMSYRNIYSTKKKSKVCKKLNKKILILYIKPLSKKAFIPRNPI